jgi:hypothetical protein
MLGRPNPEQLQRRSTRLFATNHASINPKARMKPENRCDQRMVRRVNETKGRRAASSDTPDPIKSVNLDPPPIGACLFRVRFLHLRTRSS